MTLGELIKEKRKRAGLTQEQLASKAEIAVNSLRLYEANKRKPKFETLTKISNALGEPLNVFLGVPSFNIVPDEPAFLIDDGELRVLFFEEKELLDIFSLLNDEGRNIAVDRVQELTEIPRYRKEQPSEED